ncbi:MAG: glycoside hydrolase family 3 N-terminal domain-containing protein [Phycisphaerales bacterium]|nr:glycoside hydrolase family 3 N-terminal domain-containing protein [Phycisphaerales bacterium]
MNIAKQIGSQCIFGFSGSSLDEPKTRDEIKELKSLFVRGVILFDHDIAGNHPRNIRSPKQLKKLIEDIRNELGADTIVAIDQEGGSVSRLDQENGFLPTLSAAGFAKLEEIDQAQYALKQAQQLASLGINLNFAPCIDLAIEPDSPIIAGKARSFGTDIEQVLRNASITIDEYRRAGVRCCLKHFPGHGSAKLDSHLGVCDITQTHQQSEIDIYRHAIPLFGNRVAVMPGHLMHRGIDLSFPASLSHQHITELLRGDLKFDGVVITDSLDMRAIRDQFGEVESCIHAINAGADILLDGLNAPGYRETGVPRRIIEGLINAMKDGRIHDPESCIALSTQRLNQFFKEPNSTKS